MKKCMMGILGVILLISTASAQQDLDLVEQFKKAVIDADLQKKQEIYLKLEKSPDQVERLKQDDPYYFSVYELQKLAQRVEDLKENQALLTEEKERQLSESEGTGGFKGANSNSQIKGNNTQFSNQDAVRHSANQDRSPNKVTSKNSNQNQPRIEKTLKSLKGK